MSLELAAADGLEHKVIEAESNARLQRVLGADRVIFHALSDDSLRDIRRDPDLVAAYWDGIAEEFTAGVRLLDMGANAGAMFWRWWDSGSGRLMLGDGTGTGALIVTTAEVEAMRLAREALARVAEEMPNARLLVMSEAAAISRPFALAKFDGRTRKAKFLREVRNVLAERIGGTLTASAWWQVETAARLTLFLEELDAKLATGGKLTASEARNYATWSEVRDRTLRELGLHGVNSAARALA